jgi:hypothetical protein
MGTPLKPLPAKLIVGLIFKDPKLSDKARRFLSKRFGPVDFVSPVLDFNLTDYYENEMGKGLKRSFISFAKLIAPESLPEIKHFTNALEKKMLSGNNKRGINIDPGYVTLSKLILASTKNFSHRIYAKKDIFLEITLHFKDGKFEPGRWTYPDYRSDSHIAIFNEIREKYYRQIEKKYGLPQISRCV